MKVSLKFRLAALALGMSYTGMALAAGSGNAQNLQAGILKAKAVVDRAIAATGGAGGGSGGAGGAPSGDPWGGGFPGGGFPGGGTGPWLTADVAENDAIALPILIQASTSLGQAASFSDQAKLAYLGGNIAFGNFRFAEACNRMGISRSQIARANTAALQPPMGFLAAFGPDLTATVVELNALRASEGCP